LPISPTPRLFSAMASAVRTLEPVGDFTGGFAAGEAVFLQLEEVRSKANAISAEARRFTSYLADRQSFQSYKLRLSLLTVADRRALVLQQRVEISPSACAGLGALLAAQARWGTPLGVL